MSSKKTNVMRQVKIEKVTLNVGAGHDQKKLEKGVKLLEMITGIPAIKTKTNKRIAGWGLRPGLPIGAKITLRNKPAEVLLKRLLLGKENKLKPSQFDDNGNLSFGIHEYIDVPDVQYDPQLGVMGFEVCVTFERAGYRIKRRRILKKKVPTKHRVTKEETMDLLTKIFNVKISGDN